MATKDKGSRQPKKSQTRAGSDREGAAQSQQTARAADINDKAAGAEEKVSQEQGKALPPPPPSLPANYPTQGKPTLRKGVYLSALIYVEGERAPAQDFASEAKAELKKALADPPGDLTITIKRLTVKNNVEDEEPDDSRDNKMARAKQKEDSFDF